MVADVYDDPIRKEFINLDGPRTYLVEPDEDGEVEQFVWPGRYEVEIFGNVVETFVVEPEDREEFEVTVEREQMDAAPLAIRKATLNEHREWDCGRDNPWHPDANLLNYGVTVNRAVALVDVDWHEEARASSIDEPVFNYEFVLTTVGLDAAYAADSSCKQYGTPVGGNVFSRRHGVRIATESSDSSAFNIRDYVNFEDPTIATLDRLDPELVVPGGRGTAGWSPRRNSTPPTSTGPLTGSIRTATRWRIG
ncbi:hypothetical protein BRC83_10535 [Halobacteriales archaeon QS_1_68_17]|nr:MAG: hypothetical protein BRC83_10535 [Halobacteriales archaeon QS_1_68_17]